MSKFRFKIFICLILSISALSCSVMPDELKSAEHLMENHPDSALMLLKQVDKYRLLKKSDKALYALLLSQAYDKNDVYIESDSLISIATEYYTDTEPLRASWAWFYFSRCARNRDDEKTQAQALIKAQEYAEMTDKYKLRALIASDEADMYESQGQKDSALVFNKKALHWFQIENDHYNASLAAISIGDLCTRVNQLDSAMKYLRIAQIEAAPLNNISIYTTIYKVLGTAYYYAKDYKNTLYHYHKAPLTGDNHYDDNKWYLLAFTFVKTQRFDSAKYYLKKIKSPDSMSSQYYELWESVYLSQNDYVNAFKSATKINQVKDSIYNYKLNESFASVERKYKYEHLALENKTLIIENKQRGITILVSLLILSLIMFAFLSMRFRSKKREVEILLQLSDREKALLDKANEYNALLKNQTKMQQILLQNVEQYKTESLKGKYALKTQKESTVVHNVHDDIIKHIDGVYPDFSQRILTAYPQLTMRDVFICCMLLGGFDTGTIATLLDVQYESMNIHRSRLRKKLNIDSSTNLIDFLRNF